MPVRSSHRRLWTVAALVAVVLLLIAATPTLLSSRAGNAVLLAVVNRSISGVVSAREIKVSWLSGVSAKDVVVADASRDRILAMPYLETDSSLLRLSRVPAEIGKARIEVTDLELVSYPDGTTNLGRALSRRGRPQPPERVKKPAWPFIGTVELAVDHVTWRSPSEHQPRAGSARGVIRVDPKGESSIKMDGQISTPQLGAALVKADLFVTIDPQRRLCSFPQRSIIQEQSTDGARGNRFEITPGSTLSWGDEPGDARIQFSYDLARLAQLLRPLLPERLELVGQDSTLVHLHGALADGQGATRLRGLTMDETSFGFSRIAIAGFALKGGRLPLQLVDGRLSARDAVLEAEDGGRIILAGEIDLRGKEPRFVVHHPQTVMRDVAFGAQFGAGPLRFLPITWGYGSRELGRAQVGGVATVEVQQASVPLGRGRADEARMTGTVSVDRFRTDAPLYVRIGGLLGPVATNVVRQLSVEEQSFATSFVLADGRISYERLPIRAGTIQFQFGGSVGLDGSLKMKADLTASGVPLPARLTISGTTDHPEAHLAGHLSPPPVEDVPDLLGRILKRLP